MVTLTIDGKTVEVPEGTTVLNAARAAGIEIPTLCDHPELTPYGGCRLCLVEIEGARTLMTSCTVPVGSNMKVQTKSPKVLAARKFVLSLIFSERNHFCPYCQVSGGDCDLQNSAYELDMTHWPLIPNYSPYPVDASHKYIVLDNNRCILCRRCVRACGELVGNHTLGFEERGAKSTLIADLGVPLGESTCVSCGTCVQVCPTGALIDRWSAYRGHRVDLDITQSICGGCSVGCSVEVLTRDNNLVRVEGDWEGPVNGGVLCERGRYSAVSEQRERITTPLVRKNGALEPATWEEALAAAAGLLQNREVAALASTRLSAEALYIFKKLFADGLKSGLVTTFEEGYTTAAASELAAARGAGFEGKLEDLKSADTVVIFGDDLTVEHRVAGFFVKRILPNGVRLLLVDTGANGLDGLSDLSLKYEPGKEVDVLRGIASAIIGKEESLASLAASTGIDAQSFQQAAELLKAAEKPVLVFGARFVAQQPQALPTLMDLADLTGAKVLGTKGGANSVTAAQYQLDSPFALNGHQVIYAALGDEDPSEDWVSRLSNVPGLVLQASYVSPLMDKADVVLPVANFQEQDGHFVNLEGRLQTARHALQPAADVRTNVEALTGLAAVLGVMVDDGWQEALAERLSSVAIAA